MSDDAETTCIPGCDQFIVRTMNLHAKHWPAGTTFNIECVLELGHDGTHQNAAGSWSKPIDSRR